MDRYSWMEFRHTVKEWRMALVKLHWKHEPAPSGNAGAIAVIDGTQYDGGLCDRMKGIITLYAWCKQRGLGFRIMHTHPFRLEEYLVPAEYDWILKPGELSLNIRHSRFFHMRGENLARRLIKLDTQKQILYSNNRDCLDILNADRGTDYRWGELFRELFRPSPEMEAMLQKLKAGIGGPYNASVFRFQNLLGDFKEYGYRPVGDEEARRLLMQRCLEDLKKHISETDGRPMLVTSDSITFLTEASRIENVHIIPGSLAHMGGAGKDLPGNPHEVYMKSFLDFYMLSEAETVACIGTSQMYPSQFPLYAAKVNDRPFSRILI